MSLLFLHNLSCAKINPGTSLEGQTLHVTFKPLLVLSPRALTTHFALVLRVNEYTLITVDVVLNCFPRLTLHVRFPVISGKVQAKSYCYSEMFIFSVNALYMQISFHEFYYILYYFKWYYSSITILRQQQIVNADYLWLLSNLKRWAYLSCKRLFYSELLLKTQNQISG